MNRRKKENNKKDDAKNFSSVKEELYQWFSESYSPPFVANKTGYDLKVVKTHYAEWCETKAEEIDLEGQKRNALTNLVLQLDKIIASFEEQIERIENAIKSKPKEFDLELHALMADILHNLMRVHVNKAYFLLHPVGEIRFGEIR